MSAHHIVIEVMHGDTRMGTVEKGFDGTYREAVEEIRATLARNRAANPSDAGFTYKVKLNGAEYSERQWDAT